MKYTKEQIRAANDVDIAALLISRGENLKREGHEYRWMANQSVTIRENLWCDHGENDKGGSAVDFVMEFMGLGFKEAVKMLLNGEDGREFKKAEKIILPRPAFELPPRDSNMRKVFAYLTKTRGCDPDVVSLFAHERTIYQSSPYGNVVFVGKDECGVSRYAHSRSTNQNGKLRFDVGGSDKNYSFNHKGDSMFLYAFESPIDMLSYISLHPDNWQKNHYIALGGLALKPLLHYLENNNEISPICLCYDNDNAGAKAANDHQKVLMKMGYGVAVNLPTAKDWNEELLNYREQEQTEEPCMGVSM